jgi:transposase InsO family protein
LLSQFACGTQRRIVLKLQADGILANDNENLEHLRRNIEEFIEQYYNRQRLHSALGY